MKEHSRRIALFDSIVDDILEHGEVAHNAKGDIVYDENGKPLRVAPSAQMLGQIRAWLGERGAFAEAMDNTPMAQVKLRLSQQQPPDAANP